MSGVSDPRALNQLYPYCLLPRLKSQSFPQGVCSFELTTRAEHPPNSTRGGVQRLQPGQCSQPGSSRQDSTDTHAASAAFPYMHICVHYLSKQDYLQKFHLVKARSIHHLRFVLHSWLLWYRIHRQRLCHDICLIPG